MRIKVLGEMGRRVIELPMEDAELDFQMKRIGVRDVIPICRLAEVMDKDNPLSVVVMQ